MERNQSKSLGIKALFAAAAILFAAAFNCAAASPYKPLIGISSGFSGGKVTVKYNYCRAVERAGGIAVVLPLVRDAAGAEALVSKLDGLIMSGGEDIDPAYYGEALINGTVKVNVARDSSDFLLLGAADRAGMPILGICRGEQIVNVYFGGTLIQDIHSQVNTVISHRQQADASVPTHGITIEAGSLLSTLTGKSAAEVNSFHHQAVKTLASCFRVSASAGDGIVEAFEYKGGERWIVCVQFHPEAFVAGGDDTFLPLFEALREQAAAYSGKHK